MIARPRPASLLLALLMLAGPSAPALADYYRGVTAYDMGDFRAAASEWNASAQQTDARSQYRLGQLYEMGRGVPLDLVEAHAWYNIAAAGGLSEAGLARDALGNRMTATQLELAQYRASNRRGLVAQQGLLPSGSGGSMLSIVSQGSSLLLPSTPSTATAPAQGSAASTLETVGKVRTGVGLGQDVVSLTTGKDVTTAGTLDSLTSPSAPPPPPAAAQPRIATPSVPSSPIIPPQPSTAEAVAYAPTQPSSLAKPQPSQVALSRDCAVCPEVVTVKGGVFRMGAEDGDLDERPVHTVRIGYDLAVSRSEITFDDWDRCVSDGGCAARAADEGWGRGPMPVIYVSWSDAKAYTDWLSRKTGKGYRLPSEAEWEYLARGASTGRYWWGDSVTAQANCRGCGPSLGSRPVAAASLPANPFGLTEVLGNVLEWVEDCATPDYATAPTDGMPVGGASCGQRTARGGSWQTGPGLVRVSTRYRLDPSYRSAELGFRVVRTIEAQK